MLAESIAQAGQGDKSVSLAYQPLDHDSQG